jgi:cell division control protein 24
MPPQRPLPFNIPSASNNPLSQPSDNRSKLIHEMVDTERKYILSLEELQAYEKEAVTLRVLGKDMAHGIFANLNELLDFQRRFLINMERVLTLPVNEQRIGQLFIANVSACPLLTNKIRVVFFFFVEYAINHGFMSGNTVSLF